MKQSAVLFDFGNVLVKTRDPRPRLAWDGRLGLPPGSVQAAVHNDTTWVQAQLGHISAADYWASVGTALNLAPQTVAELAEDFYAGDVLDADLVALIDELRADGVRVGLLSNFSAELHPWLNQLGLAQRMDSITISADIGVMKPDARAYAAALTALGTPAHATVFVDDLPQNVVAAQQLGMAGVVYTDGMDLRAHLRAAHR